MKEPTHSDSSHDLPFKKFLQLTVLPLVFIAVLGIALTMQIDGATHTRQHLLMEQSVKSTVISQRSIVNLELLRVYLATMERAIDPKVAREAYVNAWGMLADSSIDRKKSTEQAMLRLLEGVKAVWHERLIIDAKRAEIDNEWQQLNKTLYAITSLTATENKLPNQTLLTEEILYSPSLKPITDKQVEHHLVRLDQNLLTVCSSDFEPRNPKNAKLFRDKCQLTSVQITNLHEELKELNTLKLAFEKKVASVDKESIALRRLYAEEENRGIVEGIDEIHHLTDRTGLSFALLFIALCFTAILIALFYYVLYQPLRQIVKSMKAFESNDVQPTQKHRSIIREINMIISWVMKVCHMTRFEREQAKQLADAYQQLLMRSHLDPLTGVGNRRFLEEAIQRKVKLSSNTGIVMLDIDHFKSINDAKGHLFGDRVLKAVGTLLKTSVSQDQAIYRYGGEEFCIIVPDGSNQKLKELAEQLLQSVQTISRDTGEIENQKADNPLTISIGLSGVNTNEGEKDLLSLLHEADYALYEAKDSGRNCYRQFEKSESSLNPS